MRKYNLNIAAAVCVLMMTLAMADPAGAITRYVPSPYPTIQGAIDASAMNGDEIEVAPGTYNEAIIFKGKAVRLYSNGGSGVTTINGAGHYHVVQCIGGEDANTILEGFTITGGNANGTEPNDRHGGGMYNYNSSPTVIYCTFYKNSTGNGQASVYPAGTGGIGGDGAGMYNLNSSPTVSYCTFEENSTGIGGTGGPGKDADPNPDERGGYGWYRR